MHWAKNTARMQDPTGWKLWEVATVTNEVICESYKRIDLVIFFVYYYALLTNFIK